MEKKNLTSLIAQGNSKAFESFYRLEYKKAVFYTNQYLHNYEMSEDLVQDAFVAIWTNRESLDPEYPVQPYLYSVIRNKAINLLKRLTVDSKVKDEILRREYQASLGALSDHSAEVVVLSQLNDQIAKAFSELPAKFSDSFVDSRINGLTYKEIADKEGISVKVVEYHITQALKFFREKLKDFLVLVFFLSGI